MPGCCIATITTGATYQHTSESLLEGEQPSHMLLLLQTLPLQCAPATCIKHEVTSDLQVFRRTGKHGRATLKAPAVESPPKAVHDRPPSRSTTAAKRATSQAQPPAVASVKSTSHPSAESKFEKGSGGGVMVLDSVQGGSVPENMPDSTPAAAQSVPADNPALERTQELAGSTHVQLAQVAQGQDIPPLPSSSQVCAMSDKMLVKHKQQSQCYVCNSNDAF